MSLKSDYNIGCKSDFGLEGGMAMAGEELPGNDYLWEYNRLCKEYDSIFHDVALASGLSDSAFAILYHIMELGDGCLQRDICDQLFMSKQTIHSAIQKLRDQGYLVLEPGKGRNMHIRLTEAGRQVVCRVVLPVRGLEEAAFDQLGDENSRELLRLTGRYIAAYRALAQEYIRRLRGSRPH